jgi:hypothetical protein
VQIHQLGNISSSSSPFQSSDNSPTAPRILFRF